MWNISTGALLSTINLEAEVVDHLLVSESTLHFSLLLADLVLQSYLPAELQSSGRWSRFRPHPHHLHLQDGLSEGARKKTHA